MSHTDKDKPLAVRKREANAPEFTSWNEEIIWERANEFGFKYHESTVGLDTRGVKALKRARSKRNRRRDIPQTSIRGYGWGEENIRLAYRD